MDVIPDMDDLLNELEAAEASTEKVKLISDLVFHSNNVLLNTGNGLNIIQGDVSNLDHIGETAVSANILSAPKEPEKYLEYDVTSSKHLDNTEIAVRNEKSIICGEHGEKLESVPEKACISYLDSAEINDILNDIITSLTIMESNTSCNANISSTDSGLGERIHDYDDTAFRNSTTMKIKAMEYSDVADLAEEFGQISSVTHKADDKGVNVDSDVVLTNGKYADMEQYLSRWDMDSVSSVVQEQMSEDSVGQISFITTKEEIIGTTEVRAEQAIDKSDSDTKIQSDLDFHTKIQASEKNIDEVVPNNGKSTKLRMADLFADVNPIYGAQHERAVNAKEDLSPDNVQQVMDECVSDGTVSIKHSSSSSCHPFTNTGSEENIESFSNSVTVRKSKDGNNAEIKEEEESKEMECSDDKLSSDYEKPSGKLEGTQAISVVLSTHDISQNSEFKYLTESERQLGKKQPVWIADKETLSCMICCVKFTVFIRRHHCRCCGRVLCANCTSQKATLLYTNNPKKEHRVCDPCFETLRRIEEYERKTSTSETAIVNDSLNSSDVHQETSRITKPVLKLKTRSENAVMSNDNQNASMGIGGHGNASVKRTVTFLDGLHPGDISNDETQTLTADLSPAKPKKHGSRKQHVSRRLQQLQIAEESACFLPQISCKINDKPVTDDVQQRVEGRLYLRSTEGKIIECSDIKEQIALLRNFNPLETDDIITTDQNKTVMCIVSRGMTFVGLDEIFLAYYCDEDLKELPIYHLWRIYEIYENALSPQNESSDEELGIRPAHFRVPALNHTILFSNMKEPISRDILLFRPSTQVFDNLLIPSSPFLVAVFIHQSETIWANVIPQRLLIRIGLQLKFYPTPVINDFNRKPVYNSSFDTSVLKMFNDFRNWRFQMPFIPSSTLIIQNDCECILSIPNWALDKIAMLINKNRNMIAWALDFNADADSYLVCKQSDSGSFESQVFTHGIVSRKVIGASFVIIDGALKAGGEPFIVNVLEDGVAMRFRSDVMESLIETLLVEKGFELKSTTMKISIKWSSCYIQRHDCDLVSPIDGFSLIGCYEYGLKKSRVLGSFYPIPNQVGWSLRLVSVYNIDKGRFAQRVQSKVFSVSEQVTARIAVTLVPFVDDLIKHDLRDFFFRIHLTDDDAEYKTKQWSGMEEEFTAWLDLLDNQVAPSLFNVCSYVTAGFNVELHLALISMQPNP